MKFKSRLKGITRNFIFKQWGLSNFYSRKKFVKKWLESIEDNETILYKSKEEYTSPIEKIYQVGEDNSGDMICVTENSIYVVTKNILPKK